MLYTYPQYLLRQSLSDGVQSTLGVDILATDYDHNDSTEITVVWKCSTYICSMRM